MSSAVVARLIFHEVVFEIYGITWVEIMILEGELQCSDPLTRPV